MEDWWMLKWDEIPYVSVDVETTGFSHNDRICEITVVQAVNGEIKTDFTSLINPGCPISTGATQIHGIEDSDVRDAPRLVDISDHIMDLFSRDSPWVGHNLGFDLRMLSYDIPKDQWPRGVPTLCTMDFARHHHFELRSRPKHRLIDLVEHFNIEIPESMHRSGVDAIALARIVPKMLAGYAVGPTMTKWNHEW